MNTFPAPPPKKKTCYFVSMDMPTLHVWILQGLFIEVVQRAHVRKPTATNHMLALRSLLSS